MGLVVPVFPALQRVDVCVHTGLATGHRTRHGETRGSGAAVGRMSRRSAGVVGITGRLELLCVSVWVCGGGVGCEVEQASQLASLCSQAERERGEEGGRGPGIPPRVRRSQCAPSSAPWSDCQKQQSRCRWGSEKGADESLGDSAAEVRHRDGEASGCWGREETDP